MKLPNEPNSSQLVPPDERLCPACMGYKFVCNDGGRAAPCPLGCSQELAQKHLRALSGMSQDQFGLSFDHMWTKRIMAAVTAITGTLAEKPRGFMLLSGSYGCGKTHLLCASVNEAMRLGYTAVYTTSEQLLDHFRRAYAPDTKTTYDGVYSKVVGATVLCIDELDRFNTTEWAEAQMFKLLNERYQAACSQWEPKLTLMATNRQITELSPYLQSRLGDRVSQVFDFFGEPDMRGVRA